MLLILEQYCKENKLVINTKKTKILIFKRGPRPDVKFYINGKEIEIVNQFRYLGVVFTSQLKFYAHVEHVLQKAKAQIGMIFAKTPIKEVNLNLALNLFQCYIMPIFEYNLMVWTADFRKSMDKDINSVFLCYLKRWLGLPYSTRSSMVYHLTQTAPLTQTLLEKAQEKLNKVEEINLSLKLDHRELLVVKDRERKVMDPYKIVENVPSGFWKSKMITNLPVKFYYRRNICKEIVDSDHWKICKLSDFHTHSLGEECICIFCEEHCSWFHSCET